MPLSAIANVFTGNPLDRASERRPDGAWLAEKLADPGSLAVALWNGAPLTETSEGKTQLSYLPAAMAQELSNGWERLLFMGLWKDTAVFALDLEGGVDPAEGPLQGLGKFQDLRAMAMVLPGTEAAIAATAKGMFEWRRKHRHCANCGEPSVPAEGGWKRACPACKAEHFPRTDPVSIMLATHNGRCLMGRQAIWPKGMFSALGLMGRQAIWPKGMFSALAGFLEPGESIEECCARELKEEAGLNAVSVRYHSTQPWPYPSSLMIGLIAEVDSDEATPDQTELEAVRWFTKEEARDLLAGKLEGLFCPPPLAIAHQLLKSWANEPD